MQLWRLTGALLALAYAAPAQSVAPEVLLLARIQSHLRAALAALPNYMCLETITRFHAGPKAQLKPLDTVRLEIAYSNHREWYGSPGGRTLSADDPVQFIGSGMIGTGAFALNLNNIMAGAIIRHRGEEVLGGRTAVRYDFNLPASHGGLMISVPAGSAAVGEEGSFWADPQSLDIIRLESRAAEIPASLPVTASSERVDYARTRIGEIDVLLPQQAELHMVHTTGEQSYDRLEFTHCRAFAAESTVSFNSKLPVEGTEGATGTPEAITPSALGEALPSLLEITVQLTTRIGEKDVVGTLIEGRVSGDVRRAGKTVVPNGSVVRGRIRRLERSQQGTPGGSGFIVDLEFTEVEVNGGAMRFYADLVQMDPRPGIRPRLTEGVVRTDWGYGNVLRATANQSITMPSLPGVAALSFPGPTFTIPNGFRMIWRTREPLGR